MKSYIALRSFVFLFNSLIFLPGFDIYHYYHSCLASEFLPDLIGEYKEYLRSYFMSLFLFCRSFLFYAWRNYNVTCFIFVFHFRFVLH